MGLDGELSGIIVVSLEQAVAAPYCGLLMANAGARGVPFFLISLIIHQYDFLVLTNLETLGLLWSMLNLWPFIF